MSDKRVREPKDPRDLVLGDTVGMSRKSSDGEKAGKSLEGQEDAILETCEDYGLPIATDYVWRERAGLSGKLWWEGGGSTGIEGDGGGVQKTRPVLTKIVNGIVAGSIRCLVVWSLDRCARHVGIMESLMEIMNKYGCLLYDRRGPVDIFSAEGRDRVRSNMTSAQYARERAQVDAPRGVDHNKKKGKIVINANRLGFRAVGKASGEIIHKPEEQDLAYELFHMYVLGTPQNPTYRLGEPGHGPYSVTELSDIFSSRPDLPWLDDKYPRRVFHDDRRVIHPATLYSILSDSIYQGRQRHRGQESECPIFLKADGAPVIPTWLYEAAQVKLESGRQNPGVKKNSYDLSNLIRCGVCGIVLTANASGGRLPDGTWGKVPAWVATSRKGTRHRCLHKLPALTMALVSSYVIDHLGPELMAELQARNDAGENSALANERATLRRDLAAAQRRLEDELPTYLGQVSPMMLGSMETKVREEIDGYQARLQAVERRLTADHKFVAGIGALHGLSHSARRDVLREVLRWVAIVPTDPTRTRHRSPNGTRLPKEFRPAPDYPSDEGRLAFLTTWGTMHSAVIYKDLTEAHHMPVHYLRPARPEEMLSTVNELPDPRGFIRGIEDNYTGVRRQFCIEEIAPGFMPSDAETTAVFNLDEDTTDGGQSQEGPLTEP